MSAAKPPSFDPQSIEDWGPYQAPIDRHPVLATIWFAIVALTLLGFFAIVGLLMLLAVFFAFRALG